MDELDSSELLLRASATFLLMLGACGEPECPQGFYKDGKLCRRLDASIAMDDAAVTADDDDAGSSGTVADGQVGKVLDSAVPESGAWGSLSDSGSAGSTAEAGSSSMVDAQTVADTGPSIDATTPPMGECDANRICSAGFGCIDGKCVSECETTKCDANATCALKAGAPVCSCNNGYVAQGSGNAITCARDLACEQLGCHTNAACEKGTNQLLHCVCKPGYMGNGTSCAAVTCEPLAIENGTVAGGTSYNDTATYRCNSGYELDLLVGNWTRTCGADKQWSGSATRCNPVYCAAPPSIKNATVAPGSAAPFNSKATYTCDTGHEPSGSTTITCGANKQWSAPPTCKPKCGNGRLDRDIGEDCDLSVAGTSPWRCSTTCRFITIYTPCWRNDDCEVGEHCSQFKVCTKSCSSDTSCPATPAGARLCYAEQGNQCFARCSTSADCAPGLMCFTGSGDVCGGCYDSSFCPAGKMCLTESGGPPNITAGVFGRCQ